MGDALLRTKLGVRGSRISRDPRQESTPRSIRRWMRGGPVEPQAQRQASGEATGAKGTQAIQMEMPQSVGGETRDQASARKAKSLRVKVVDNRDGHQITNVTLPLGMVRWGMKMAARFAPEMKDADLDWDAIAEMIRDGQEGELVHVEDEEAHQTISVAVE